MIAGGLRGWRRALAVGTLLACAACAACAVDSAPPALAGPLKTLRVAFPAAETGFDPARVVDLYSRTITPHIFEGLYQYDHLARPFKIRPLTAAGMPEVSDNYRTWTVRLQPGIRFADDPAFGGAPRELVAADYVYAIKRFVDPANNSPAVTTVLDAGFVGLAALRDEAIKTRQRFDYDRTVPGLRALDRHTIEFRLEQPRPRFLEFLAAGDLFGAVAREVVERYGEDIMAHPVGTGPFVLAQWRRSSLIVLERNPGYRERHYDAEPRDDDVEGRAIATRLAGRRIPMVDRVEVSIINESQPAWLAFLAGDLDYLSVPGDFVPQAMPGGQVAPHLARRGIEGRRTLNADGVYAYFNMEDPVIGGYTPERVALRRAISLGLDVEARIRLLFRGQGVPAQSFLIPHTSGYDPAFKSEMGDFDPARAKALLDLFGFVDRDGDGWREQPDGSALELELATQPDQFSRRANELWQKDMNRLGIRLRFSTAQWPEQLKAGRAGKLQIWALGGSAASPDGQESLAALYSGQIGSQNFARFRHERMDRIYEAARSLPDGPERDALFFEAKRIGVAYAPYKMFLHRISNMLNYKHLIGHRRPLFWTEWFHMVDIDPAAQAAHRR